MTYQTQSFVRKPQPSTQAYRATEPHLVTDGKGTAHHVSVGDWVVVASETDSYAMSDDDFRARFDPEDTAALQMYRKRDED